MTVELSYFQKLWNRGVDIGVGVITSVIVGLIGLAFWRVKLWLDLRAAAKMQHQQHRIAEEFEREKRQQVARVRRDNLRAAMEALAKRAETVSNAFQLADCWEHYYQWLLDNQLYQIPRNFSIAIPSALRGATSSGAWRLMNRSSIPRLRRRPASSGAPN